MPEFGSISHLDLTVSDAERSARWYVDTLGLRRVRRADLQGRIMIVLMHPDTGLIIGLNQHDEQAADRFDEHRPGLDHVAFAVAERDELDRWQDRLSRLAVEHSPVTDSPSGSGTALVFRDPDDIQLEFWWTRPRTADVGSGASGTISGNHDASEHGRQP
jgi:glyoxylase I family protein